MLWRKIILHLPHKSSYECSLVPLFFYTIQPQRSSSVFFGTSDCTTKVRPIATHFYTRLLYLSNIIPCLARDHLRFGRVLISYLALLSLEAASSNLDKKREREREFVLE